MKRIEVSAGARLHFGLLRPSSVAQRVYGGAGMMVDQPTLRVIVKERLDTESNPTVQNEVSERLESITDRFLEYVISIDPELGSRPKPIVEALELPPLHSGLGTGTQLALATTLALSAWYQWDLSIAQSAMIAKRGRRSAVGTYGFYSGGFILDGGCTSGNELGKALGRFNTPQDWRVVLLTPPQSMDRIEGNEEEKRFLGCPSPNEQLVEELESILEHEMVPALQNGDFDTFAQSVTRYNHDAGMLFAAVQGGPYHGPAITQLIQRVQAIGNVGVGQSSWGPTVFAICKSEGHAEELVREIKSHAGSILTVSPLNRPATLAVVHA